MLHKRLWDAGLVQRAAPVYAAHGDSRRRSRCVRRCSLVEMAYRANEGDSVLGVGSAPLVALVAWLRSRAVDLAGVRRDALGARSGRARGDAA